jgi:hypothetical protein
MSNNDFSTHGRRHVGQLPGDYKPVSEREPSSEDLIGTALARVYALILSWPTAEQKQEEPEAETA